MQRHPAIVVIAYNRPQFLQRLLTAVAAAHYPEGDVPLIISIDKSEVDEVGRIADSFEWHNGTKTVIKQETHLGLKEHVLRCGDLTAAYGNIIMLEDDLLVSPWFYKYAIEASAHYQNEEKIAGISLFNYHISENGFFPFTPVPDGSDVYFLQVASSWGQLFYQRSWSKFRNWLKDNHNENLPAYAPAYLRKWSTSSWKKHFNHYLLHSQQFFVFPRVGLSTNFGEPGVNTDRRGLFQTELLHGAHQFNFVTLQESGAVYDAWYEIVPDILSGSNSNLAGKNFTVDLHATKEREQISTTLLLSGRNCHSPLVSFAGDMQAAEDNVIYNLKGNRFHLGNVADFDFETDSNLAEHFVSLNTIKEIVFHKDFEKIRLEEKLKADKRIDEMSAEIGLRMQQFENNFYFNQQYPLFLIGIVYKGNQQALEETLANMAKQDYPATQIKAVVFHEASVPAPEVAAECLPYSDNAHLIQLFQQKITEYNPPYLSIMRSGDTYYDNALSAVSTIFKKYTDIAWLTGIETIKAASGFQIVTGATSTRRWNKHIFERNLYNNSARYIPPAATFWKIHLWREALNDINPVSRNNFFEDLWLAFFSHHALFTSDVYLSSSANYSPTKLKTKSKPLRYSLVESNVADRIREFFFINNVPYLRAFYRTKNQLAQVVRFDYKSQSYFLNDY